MDYNATLGTTLPINDDDLIERLFRDLVSAHVAVHTLDHDTHHAAITITFPAAGVEQATQTALLMAQAADLGTITSLEVLPTQAYDLAAQVIAERIDSARNTTRAAGPIPELVSVATAAHELGVSRPTVRRMIGKELQGRTVDGMGAVITRASLDAVLAAKTDA